LVFLSVSPWPGQDLLSADRSGVRQTLTTISPKQQFCSPANTHVAFAPVVENRDHKSHATHCPV
jgi:hypothetical protein